MNDQDLIDKELELFEQELAEKQQTVDPTAPKKKAKVEVEIVSKQRTDEELEAYNQDLLQHEEEQVQVDMKQTLNRLKSMRGQQSYIVQTRIVKKRKAKRKVAIDI